MINDILKNKKIICVVVITIICVLLMSYVESIIKPTYLIKSIIKLTLFLGLIVLFSTLYNENIFKLININKNKISPKLIYFLLFVYIGIIVAYLLFQNYIDLQAIKDNLLNKENLNKDNYIYIFSYIIFINSFLEEIFFRGFIYQVFNKENYGFIGILYSSLLFALYHFGIMDSWFNILLIILIIVSLFVAGIFLEKIAIKYDNVLASYLVHASANLAINTIGVMMLLR